MIFLGKGARTRAANAETNKEKKAQAQKKAAVRKRNSLIARVCTTVVALVLVATIVFTVWSNVSMNNGSQMRDVTVAESENMQVDGAMFAYFLNYNYLNYVSQYGDYLSLLGLDTSVSLKNQTYSGDQTWFDYFASAAESTVGQYLVLSEAARAAGISLTEDELAIIAEKAKDVTPSNFGRGLNNEDIRKVLELSTLASKYYKAKIAELEPTADAIQAEYDKEPRNYQKVDYYSYTLVYADEDSTSSTSSSSAQVSLTREEAEELAQELAACTTTDEFVEWVVEYTKETAEEAPSEEDLAKIPDNLLTTGGTFTADSDVSTWLFAAAENETYVQDAESNSAFVVYFVKTPAYREEGRTINVRHILVDSEEEAQTVLDAYNNGEKTEDAFALLALKYSTDSGSVSNGGLYSNVYEGYMVDEFNDWCFDSSRSVGDTDIVKTDYGYHVMLFCGEGLDRWQADVRNDLVNTAYSAAYEELAELYPVTFYSENYSKIPA